jgi:hypothetical protein
LGSQRGAIAENCLPGHSKTHGILIHKRMTGVTLMQNTMGR